jgi:dienelactone hydrolase
MKNWLLAILAVISLSTQAGTDIVYPPRSEIYSVPSLTISDKQFLLGDKNGKEVTVNGILRFPPKPIGQKLPVIFLVHGSSGMGANIDYWSNHFLSEGYATFSMDGFTGRGLTVVGPDQAQLGRLNLILDSYKALEILAKHPRLDSNKFVMMGFSRGGQATLFASVERFNKLWNRSGTVFAAHIPFYADCVTSYIGDTKTTGKPILLHHGITDDYNPIAACKEYVGKLKAANQNVELFEYEIGPHAFDSPSGSVPPVISKDAQTVRSCRIVEKSPGSLINTQTNQEFKYTDACVELNPHVGRDDDATQKSTRVIDAFLANLFKS